MRRCTLKRFLNKADALIHLPQGLAGDIAGLLGALGVDLLEIGLVRQHPLGLLPHGAESLDHGLAHGRQKQKTHCKRKRHRRHASEKTFHMFIDLEVIANGYSNRISSYLLNFNSIVIFSKKVK